MQPSKSGVFLQPIQRPRHRRNAGACLEVEQSLHSADHVLRQAETTLVLLRVFPGQERRAAARAERSGRVRR